jgi:hypothetical protein
MSRVLLQYLLPLLLPTVVWLVWWFTLGKHQTTEDGSAAKLRQGPWFWLILGGTALLGLSLIIAALTRGFEPAGRYVAPSWEGGRVRPGHVE